MATVARTYQSKLYDFPKQDDLSVNPDRGFYTATKVKLTETGIAEENPKYYSRVSNMVYLGIDISSFSGAINKEKDKEFTPEALEAIKNMLEQVKQNNNTAIVRFCYDSDFDGDLTDGVPDKVDSKGEQLYRIEPEQSMIMKHIEQLGPILQEYSKTINTIQIGLYGAYGEAHSSSAMYPDSLRNQNVAEATTAFLEVTKGTDITIAVRKPAFYATYAGIDEENIDTNETRYGEEAYRVGIFNDGYLGSASDLGTYKNREKALLWLEKQAAHTSYGGEAVVDSTTKSSGEYNTIANIMTEAFRTHTSYLNYGWNQNLHKIWAEENYEGENELYKGKPSFMYIENHLGYRFVIRNVKTNREVANNSELSIDIKVENVGFGNLTKGKRADIIITDEIGNIVANYEDVDINARDFLSQTVVEKTINVNLPTLEAGEYKVYLRLSNGEILNNGSYYAPIKLANDNIYNNNLQANYIAKFMVK